MNILRIIGMIVLVLGILALAYGGFTYTRETHDAELGPLSIELKDKEHVNIPIWAGVLTTVVGAGLVVFARGRNPVAG